MKYFTIDEFDCTHTGKNKMCPEFLSKLDELRGACAFPFTVTSGYRDKTHPNEAEKPRGGTHTQGIAADIKVSSGVERRLIVEKAIELGFNGVGIAHNFVHVDTRKGVEVLWVY